MRPTIRQRNLFLFIGAVLAFISGALGVLYFTALPVIVNTPLISLVIATLAILVLIPSLALDRNTPDNQRFMVGTGIIGLLVSLVFFALSIKMNYFSYRMQEARFKSEDVELAGTVYSPRSPGLYPAVVFVHGSGPETRSEYRFFAKLFAQANVIGLAYDKRGTGSSTGKLYESNYQDYAQDALAAVQYLKQRQDVIPNCIGLVGFSEAEWVGPLAVSQSSDVAFLAVIGASGVSPAKQVNEEIAIRLRDRGYSKEDVARALALNERVFKYQRTGEGAEALQLELRTAQSEAWFRDAGDIPSELYPLEEYSWWRSVMDFDAGAVWEMVKVPVLLLKGGRDPHSATGVAKTEIEEALLRSGNQMFEFVLFANADHTILEWPLGQNVPPPVFADGYPETLTRWVSQQSCTGR